MFGTSGCPCWGPFFLLGAVAANNKCLWRDLRGQTNILFDCITKAPVRLCRPAHHFASCLNG